MQLEIVVAHRTYPPSARKILSCCHTHAWQRGSGVSLYRDQLGDDGYSDRFREDRPDIEPDRCMHPFERLAADAFFLEAPCRWLGLYAAIRSCQCTWLACPPPNAARAYRRGARE